MARNSNTENAAESTQEPETTQEAGAPTTTEGAEDQRFITVTVPAEDPSGLDAGVHKRVDVIRALAKTGEWTRGDIAKHVSKLQGKKVPYQIVFQATRGIANVKAAPRGENAEGGEAATAETTTAAE